MVDHTVNHIQICVGLCLWGQVLHVYQWDFPSVTVPWQNERDVSLLAKSLPLLGVRKVRIFDAWLG